MVGPGNVTVQKNRLAGSFLQWAPIFRVTFELKIDSATKITDGFLEVLRITDQVAEANSRVPGNRIPGVWLCHQKGMCGCDYNSTCLEVDSYISSTWNEKVFFTISRDRFILIEIAQWVMDGHYFYHVYMDGKLYAQMQNRTPKIFNYVNVFTSDNWYASFGEFGQMRNLEVATWLQQPTDCYISKFLCN